MDIVYRIDYLYRFENQTKMKTYTFDEVKDQILGVQGTPRRDEYELELKSDLLGGMI